MHGGAAPQVRRKAAERVLEQNAAKEAAKRLRQAKAAKEAEPDLVGDAMVGFLRHFGLTKREALATLESVKAPERPETDGYDGPPIGPARRR
jgi:hypothetical protein